MTSALDHAPPRYRDLPFLPALASLAIAGVFGFCAAVAVVVLASFTAALAVTIVGAALVLILTWWLSDRAVAFHRLRLDALHGIALPAPPRPQLRGFWAHALRPATYSYRWRQLAYHALVGLLDFAMVLLLGAWIGAGVVGSFAFLITADVFGVEYGSLPGIAVRVVMTLVGLAALLATPWLTRALALADIACAVRLLAPDRTAELVERVETLSRSRDGAVDAADAERRRIERDLHDGTQQRLTALAMNLGIAKATIMDLPDPARRALDEAHDDVKQTLSELRMIVRGLHPAVLDDRGLDAAVSGIAARSPIPVRVTADLAHRPPRQVEAVAYFVVSEALSNAIKHAGASEITVALSSDERSLLVQVTDNGIGGADPSRGSGLTGLRQRIESVDGQLAIDSPVGGPTIITVEIPCAS